VLTDRAAWPDVWRQRFNSRDELRVHIQKECSAANAAMNGAKVAIETRDTRQVFGEATRAFRSPFFQFVGNEGSFASTKPLARVAVVGTRKLSHEKSQKILGWLLSWMAKRPAVIVSGGAFGIDSLAHRAAIRSRLPTWSVQAGGLGVLSPRGNRQLFDDILASGGVVLSERPPHYQPRRFDFLARNRIIAALSDVVVVVRAPERSGALNTAKQARELGIPVYAVTAEPDDMSALGSSRLLHDGASPITSAGDWAAMVEESEARCARIQPVLFDEPPEASPGSSGAKGRRKPVWQAETEAEAALFSMLNEESRHHDELLRQWRTEEHGSLEEVLLAAELRGTVRRRPGNHYELEHIAPDCS
jgi:DNA protecting protein DprA